MKKLKGILLSVVVATAAGAAILAISSLVVARVGELPRGPFLSVVVTGIVCSAVFLGGLSASLLVGRRGFAGSCLWIVFRLLCRWCLVDAAGGFFHTGWGRQAGRDLFGRMHWRDLGSEPQEKGEILTVILKKHTWVSACVFLYTQNVVE